MSFMLASVSNLDEARLVFRLGVDIIDLKQPAKGALGALAADQVVAIVDALAPTAKISATVGDLPMEPELLRDAVRVMAATGVEYVKIGFFPDGDWPGSIAALSELTASGHNLIAVLFADSKPDFSIVSQLASAGFRGVMLDTANKQSGSLTELMAIGELEDFVEKAKSHSLLTGLAGSLGAHDVATLLPLNADYLGFRGALCRDRKRTAELDERQIVTIRDSLSTGEIGRARGEQLDLRFGAM